MKQDPKEMKRMIKELKTFGHMLTDDFFLKIKNFKIAYSKFNFFLFSISNPIQHYYI